MLKLRKPNTNKYFVSWTGYEIYEKRRKGNKNDQILQESAHNHYSEETRMGKYCANAWQHPKNRFCSLSVKRSSSVHVYRRISFFFFHFFFLVWLVYAFSLNYIKLTRHLLCAMVSTIEVSVSVKILFCMFLSGCFVFVHFLTIQTSTLASGTFSITWQNAYLILLACFGGVAEFWVYFPLDPCLYVFHATIKTVEVSTFIPYCWELYCLVTFTYSFNEVIITGDSFPSKHRLRTAIVSLKK